MKIRFKKIIFVLLVISLMPVLSGFCVFQLNFNNLTGIKAASAATIDNSFNNTINDVSSCSEEQAAETSQAPLPIPTKHNQNSLSSCCLDGSHNGVVSIIQSLESGAAMPVAFFPQSTITTPATQIFFVNNPIFPPPTLALIKTTVLRL